MSLIPVYIVWFFACSFCDLRGGFFVSGHREMHQASLGQFSIDDSCEQCAGGIDLMLITDNNKANVTSHLNKIIMDSLIGEAPDAERYSVDDFERHRNFGEDCVGMSIVTFVNINAKSILSLTSQSEGVCGTSVGDYFPKHHITIDLNENEALSLTEVIKKSQWKNFEQFVLKYARIKEIDNVPYLDGDSEGNKHDQRKITYLAGLLPAFYVNDKVLGVYTLINDLNPPDGYRRSSQKETIGIEYMNVEIPLTEIKKFIDSGTAVLNLVPGRKL
ncbi:hypothetical protein [Dawidia soli]|uniref:Uncharacterized protein n=1 Tax=Dawidia soli TaxID=2782352 RepID=A0AAP2DFH3_9BACT|nr:hypothetical protein [Dawidia soli]MBT1689820.1 hypothetical protein [Dawidia soli]